MHKLLLPHVARLMPQLLLKDELFEIFSGSCIEVIFEGFNFYIYISERKGLLDRKLAFDRLLMKN